MRCTNILFLLLSSAFAQDNKTFKNTVSSTEAVGVIHDALAFKVPAFPIPSTLPKAFQPNATFSQPNNDSSTSYTTRLPSPQLRRRTRSRSKVSKDATCGGFNGWTCLGSGFGDCCSLYSWCGSTGAYCGRGCQSAFGRCSTSTTSASPSKTQSQAVQPSQSVSRDGTCGKNTGISCKGSRFGECCSQWGWCGASEAYCEKGCQPGFGNCVTALSSSSLATSSLSTSSYEPSKSTSSSVHPSASKLSTTTSSLATISISLNQVLRSLSTVLAISTVTSSQHPTSVSSSSWSTSLTLSRSILEAASSSVSPSSSTAAKTPSSSSIASSSQISPSSRTSASSISLVSTSFSSALAAAQAAPSSLSSSQTPIPSEISASKSSSIIDSTFSSSKVSSTTQTSIASSLQAASASETRSSDSGAMPSSSSGSSMSSTYTFSNTVSSSHNVFSSSLTVISSSTFSYSSVGTSSSVLSFSSSMSISSSSLGSFSSSTPTNSPTSFNSASGFADSVGPTSSSFSSFSPSSLLSSITSISSSISQSSSSTSASSSSQDGGNGGGGNGSGVQSSSATSSLAATATSSSAATATSSQASTPSIDLIEVINPSSCPSLPSNFKALHPLVLSNGPAGAEGPVTTYIDDDGISVPLYSTKINGVDVIYDISVPGVTTFFTADGTLVWDSTGIHMFPPGCGSRYDIPSSEVDRVMDSTSSSTPTPPVTKRSSNLAKRAQVSYIPFLVELFIGDSCYNGITDLTPVVSLEKTRPDTDPDCQFIMHDGLAYGWQCAYYRGRALCEKRARGILDGVCSDVSPRFARYCADFGQGRAELENAVLGAVMKKLVTATLKPVVFVLSNTCTMFSFIRSHACPISTADKENKIKEACAKYGDDPVSLSLSLLSPEQKSAVATISPPPLDSATMTLSGPYSITLNRVPDFYVYPVPGNLLVNGGFDTKGCGKVSSFAEATAPWTKKGMTLSTAEERFFWNRQDEQRICSSDIRGDSCVHLKAYQIAKSSPSCPKTLPDCNMWAQMQQLVSNITPGKSYTLKLMAHASSLSGALGGCSLSVAVGDATPADSSFILLERYETAPTAWEPISLTMPLLTASTYVTLRVQCAADVTGEIGIDRVSLTPN